jgi:RING-variant domain
MTCRICLESGDVGDLISPCICDGTSKMVHRTCLDSWRSSRSRRDAFTTCGVCLVVYKLRRTHFAARSRRRVAAGVIGKGLLGIVCSQLWLMVVGTFMASVNCEFVSRILENACGSCGEECRRSFGERVCHCWHIFYGLALALSLAALGLACLIISCRGLRAGRRGNDFHAEDDDAVCVICPDVVEGPDDGEAALICCAVVMALLMVLGVFFLIAFLVAVVQRAWQLKLRREGLQELCKVYPVLDLSTSSPQELCEDVQTALMGEVHFNLERAGG